MTGGDIAGLIAAGVFAILVALLALPIIRLTKVFDELIVTIRSLNQSTGPLIEEVTRTVVTTNEQLEKVDDITSNVSDASANVSALSSLVTSTVGQPLIKVASFSYGVRQAFRGGKPGDAHGTGNTHAGGQSGSAQYGSAQSSYSAGGEN